MSATEKSSWRRRSRHLTFEEITGIQTHMSSELHQSPSRGKRRGLSLKKLGIPGENLEAVFTSSTNITDFCQYSRNQQMHSSSNCCGTVRLWVAFSLETLAQTSGVTSQHLPPGRWTRRRYSTARPSGSEFDTRATSRSSHS